ncbi:MAG: zinc ribbon domain-containing protein [Acidobacteriota bacterium]
MKGLVRCASCDRPLTASWSKGRNRRYAYSHCWRQCREVNVTKAKLEGLFADALKQLQPTAGYMRLVKELVLRAWQDRKAEVTHDAADADRKAKAIQQKLDRLDEAFLFAQSIDINTYERQRDRLRQELTLMQIETLRPRRESRRRGHWRSQNAFYRERRTCGCRRRSISDSAFNNCFPRRASRSTENSLFEPG